jgi:uncharacterized protein involved in exopolysaccharide biosynthesis
MDSSSRAFVRNEEITWRDLCRIAFRRRYLILIITVFCTLAAALAAWLSPKEYEASILLSPVTSEAGSRMGALNSVMSQFGGLASLAGIGATADKKAAEALATLQSQALTEDFIQQNHLLPILFAREWDAFAARWKVSDPRKIPDLWKANRYFASEIRSVNTDPKTGLVTLTIRWTDATQASQWANDLVKMTNDFMRQQAIEESQRNIAYLQAQAAKTDMVEMRQDIYSLLQTQLNNLMLARGTEQYALKVLDPAQPPEKPSSPLPVLWTVAGLLGGFLISLALAFALGDEPALTDRESAPRGRSHEAVRLSR